MLHSFGLSTSQLFSYVSDLAGFGWKTENLGGAWVETAALPVPLMDEDLGKLGLNGTLPVDATGFIYCILDDDDGSFFAEGALLGGAMSAASGSLFFSCSEAFSGGAFGLGLDIIGGGASGLATSVGSSPGKIQRFNFSS